MRRNCASTWSEQSLRKNRQVPSTRTDAGTILLIVPPWIWVNDRTRAACGSTDRLTIRCAELMNSVAARIGSSPSSGIAAWHPVPLKVIVKSSTAAIRGPAPTTRCPSATPGQLCSE